MGVSGISVSPSLEMLASLGYRVRSCSKQILRWRFVLRIFIRSEGKEIGQRRTVKEQ